MARRLEPSLRNGGAAPVASPARMRLSAANDNSPPARYIVGRLLLASGMFAATFAVAWWWIH